MGHHRLLLGGGVEGVRPLALGGAQRPQLATEPREALLLVREQRVPVLEKGAVHRVEEDEPLAEIEAEKATQELESPAAGTLAEILVEEGQETKVRTVIAIIETD